MATVLLGWELGGGLGHVSSLRLLAEELVRHGHQPVLALKETRYAREALQGFRHPVVSAPTYQKTNQHRFLARDFTDILAIRGYAEVETLQPLVSAWRTLIQQGDVRLVVADHAPTLLLAAYRQLPAIALGNGFTIPPSDATSFPSLTGAARLRLSAERILDVVSTVQRRLQGAVPPCLPAIFQESSRYIRTIPELDPYRNVRQEAVNGPLRRVAPAPSSRIDQDFFAYLSVDFPGVPDLLRKLAERGLRGSVFLRGASAETRSSLQSSKLYVHTSPPRLADELPRARLVLHHAGLATALMSTMIGRPQVLLPRHLEQELTARSLLELGMADVLMGRTTCDEVARVIELVLSRPRFMAFAADFAEDLHTRVWPDGLGQITQHSCELIRGERGAKGH